MKEINEKDLEKAAGGGNWNSFLDMLREKSAATYREKGYTLITDDEQGLNCEDYFSYVHTYKGTCPTCDSCVHSMDTLEIFCTKGH